MWSRRYCDYVAFDIESSRRSRTTYLLWTRTNIRGKNQNVGLTQKYHITVTYYKYRKYTKLRKTRTVVTRIIVYLVQLPRLSLRFAIQKTSSNSKFSINRTFFLVPSCLSYAQFTVYKRQNIADSFYKVIGDDLINDQSRNILAAILFWVAARSNSMAARSLRDTIGNGPAKTGSETND